MTGCRFTRRLLGALIVLLPVVPQVTLAADPKLLIDLNSVEDADKRCRMNFVLENKSDAAVESLKLDLVAFDTDGGIQRRLIVEMAPVRAAKTIVRTFAVDGECRQFSAILVNDVVACAPGEPGACLDGLALSSRVKTLRLYK